MIIVQNRQKTGSLNQKNYNTTASDYLTKTPSAQKIGEKLQRIRRPDSVYHSVHCWHNIPY
jgi:hypothetical protein